MPPSDRPPNLPGPEQGFDPLSTEADAAQMEVEIRAGLGVPNANGDSFPTLMDLHGRLSERERSIANEILQRQVTELQRRQEEMVAAAIDSSGGRSRLAEALASQIWDRVQRNREVERLNLAASLLPSVNPDLRHLNPIPLQVSRIVPDENGQYRVLPENVPVPPELRQQIREGRFPGVSMGTRVDRRPDDMEGAPFRSEVLGTFVDAPARRDPVVLGPDEPRDPIGFTVTERVGVGVVNPRGLERLGISRNDPRFIEPSWVNTPAVPGAVVRGERVTVPEFEIVSNPQVRLSDVRARRFDLIERTPPPPFPVGSWVRARGMMLCVEKVGGEMLICRVWDPLRKRFEREPIGVAVKEATAMPPPPERTVWDWLVED